MSYIIALAFLLLKRKYSNEEFKDIMEISKEALKLDNTPELTKEIEEILKKSQEGYNRILSEELLKESQKKHNEMLSMDLLKKAKDLYEKEDFLCAIDSLKLSASYGNKEAEELLPTYIRDKEVAEQKKEETIIVKSEVEIRKSGRNVILVKEIAKVEEEKPVENKTVVIPPVVKEKRVNKAPAKVTTADEQDLETETTQQTTTKLADKKNAYENMLKDVLKGLATNASFNTDNDLIISFDTKSWDGLSTSEQDEIINVLKYQVGKLKRDLKGSKVSGHVSLLGSEGQSLNTFYVQTVSDGKNGCTTVVY